MNGSDPIKQAWADSVPDPVLPTLDASRNGADRFYRRVRLRNRIEYAACVLVLLCFGAYAFLLPARLARIGAAAVVCGTLVIAWQLHRRGSAVRPPDSAAAEPLLVHQRAQLVRQRDALASIFSWYLLPLIPGMTLMTLAGKHGRGFGEILHGPWQAWLPLILSAVVFGGIWWLNQRGARKLQRKIDEIDALMGDGR